MTDTDYWPFGNDADQSDPLTELRIAVTGSHPRWMYLVGFDSESEQRPTDREAAMLASFLEEYKHHWYNDTWIAKMARRALDVDGGANGVIFHKFGEDDWGFRRHSFTKGWPWSVVWPSMRDHADYADLKSKGPYTLAELMGRIHSIGEDRPMRRWSDWTANHSEVFA
jgi:hypothetical protein